MQVKQAKQELNLNEVVEHVVARNKLIGSFIYGFIDNGLDVMLFSLVGDGAFKVPNWFGKDSQTYNAVELKDKILEEFHNNTGKYTYGFLLGKQHSGFYLLCIDIDIDNECKEKARDKIETHFKKYNIPYYLETTKSNRYHIYFAVKEISDKIRKITKLHIGGDCIKYDKDGKAVPGEIEVLGTNSRHTITAYTGIIDYEKPKLLNLQIYDGDIETIEKLLLELQGGLNEEAINKFINVYKLIRKYRFLNGWEIDKAISAFCIKNDVPDQTIIEIFKAVYGDDYDEKATNYIIEHTKQKHRDLLPGTGTIIYNAKNLLESRLLTDEEKATVKDLISSIADKRKDNDDIELPDYLVGVENVIQISSRKKFTAKKGYYYKERYFIERYQDGVWQVLYVVIESDIPNAIFKRHEVINDPEPIGVKVEIVKFIKEKKRIIEVLINDEISFVPSSSFNRLVDVVEEISSECLNYWPDIDISLFRKYIAYKVKEYRKKHGGKPETCYISRTTGWNDDFTMFYHYDLNDEKHEISKDHTLYKNNKAKSFNQKEQHEFVNKILKEGKLLGVLFVISAGSILLKPLSLQNITCILAGNPGSGKTTAALTSTSLFYKSNDVLVNANNTKVGAELTLAAMNSQPIVIDEGALANSDLDLKYLIFSVASGKGRTRGKKDLTVETKDLISNVFYTTETTDIDFVKRSGTFRRMLYLVIESWKDFTDLIDLDMEEQRPNERFSGCGVDYIKFVLDNMEKVKKLFDKETKAFGIKYREITGIAKTLYASVILLEQFYTQYYKAEQLIVFQELRKRINSLLEEAKRTFIASKDDVVLALEQYLYAIHDVNFSHVLQRKNGRYDIIHRATKELYGEYEVSTKTYYIIQDKFKMIAKELEKERSLLINALEKAGVLKKTENQKGDTIVYRSKVTGGNVRAYKICFEGYQPNLEDNSPTNPEPQPEPATNDIDDSLVDAFSETTLEKQAKLKQAKQNPKQQLKEKEKPKTKKKEKEKAQAQAQALEEDNNKIIINEDELNLYDIKPTSDIPDLEDLGTKNIKAFSELTVGSFDIETTGLNETDQIMAIAFNIYKGDMPPIQYRFYLSDYNNDEAKMVSEFLDTMERSNIDVLTGYNIYYFDLPMIKAKDKENKLIFDKEYNIAGVKLGEKQQQGYCIKVCDKYIEVIDAMHLVIKYDNVARSIPAQNYDLKSVSRHFKISKPDRVILGADEIREAYKNDRKLFDEYLDEDIREAYEIFKKLAPSYYYIKAIIPFDITFFDAFRSSTASIWERILERAYNYEYKSSLIADEKVSYEGGLVINNKGLYKNVFKIDVASLYPNIMMNYQIYSRKDTKTIGLVMLKAYTKLRLELKAKAKQGDKEADLIQSALKILINSLYGFYGTGGYLFNDMKASAYVTAYGRKILKFMIDYVERNGGIIIECDTDGIFFSAKNGEEIYKGLKEELNKINFDIELEYKDCIMFASDKKNYIIIKPDNKVVKKGSKYAGRDKSRLQTEFVEEYIKRYIEDPCKAEAYKKEIRDLISLGKAYDLLKVTKKVGKGEKNIIEDAKAKGVNIEQGSIVSCVFRNKRKHKYTFDWEEQKIYDVEHYLSEFDKLVKEIDNVIQNSG